MRKYWLGLFILVSAGCQQQQAPVGVVAGRVTHGGAPVTDARIIFQKEEGSWSIFAALDRDGRYQVRTHDAAGLAPGKYKVAIVPAAPENAEPLVGQEKPTAENPNIPRRFHSTATSNLTATVQEGENPPFNFDLAKE